jgi:hypothetical protein
MAAAKFFLLRKPRAVYLTHWILADGFAGSVRDPMAEVGNDVLEAPL